jgi:hypothetical protein
MIGNYVAAVDQLGLIHPGLLEKVSPAYHGNVFINNLEATLSSGQRDTIHSCNSARMHRNSYISTILKMLSQT